jgi:methyl-accepting chemotaxis protein
MSLTIRLILTFLTILLVTSAVAFWYLQDMSGDGVRLAEHLAPRVDAAMEIKLCAAEAHLGFMECTSGQDQGGFKGVQALLEDSRWYCDAILKGASNEEGTFHPTANPNVRAKIEAARLQVQALMDLVAKADLRDSKVMADVHTGFDQGYDTFQETADQAEGLIQADMAAGLVDLKSNRTWSLAIVASLTVVGLVLGLVLGIRISRRIDRPLSTAVDRLTQGAAHMDASTAQIAAASQDLAEGATEQAAAVEETSASMEEITSMTATNADNASAANTRMRGASELVGRASSSMGELLEAMKGIAAASEQTSAIIKTIDSIAFQTNLLALNAAGRRCWPGLRGGGRGGAESRRPQC